MERVQDVAVADAAATGGAVAAGRAAVTIELDGTARDVPDGSTLADLVAALGHAPHGVGTAVNGAFVARDRRAGHVLRAGDTVLLFQPIVGG